jgi:hypothetical protein
MVARIGKETIPDCPLDGIKSYSFTSPALMAQHEEFAWRYEGVALAGRFCFYGRHDAQGAR